MQNTDRAIRKQEHIILNENQKIIVDYLENIIRDIKDEVLEIDNIIEDKDYIEHYMGDDCISSIVNGRILIGSGTLTLHYVAKSSV